MIDWTKLKVKEDAPTEQDLLVCLPLDPDDGFPMRMAGNGTGVCAECGKPIHISAPREAAPDV